MLRTLLRTPRCALVATALLAAACGPLAERPADAGPPPDAPHRDAPGARDDAALLPAADARPDAPSDSADAAVDAPAPPACAPRKAGEPVRVLIYGPLAEREDMPGVYRSLEQPYFPPEWQVTLATAEQWRAMDTADFARFALIVLGDQTDSHLTPDDLAAAFDTRAVWGPAVTGRVLVQGIDPGWHSWRDVMTAEAQHYLRTALGWLADGPGTALYVASDFGRRHLDYLSPLGAFDDATLQGDVVQITAPEHPVFAGSTSASLSLWRYTYHAVLTSVPPAFATLATLPGLPDQPLIVARPALCEP